MNANMFNKHISIILYVYMSLEQIISYPCVISFLGMYHVYKTGGINIVQYDVDDGYWMLEKDYILILFLNNIKYCYYLYYFHIFSHNQIS